MRYRCTARKTAKTGWLGSGWVAPRSAFSEIDRGKEIGCGAAGAVHIHLASHHARGGGGKREGDEERRKERLAVGEVPAYLSWVFRCGEADDLRCDERSSRFRNSVFDV